MRKHSSTEFTSENTKGEKNVNWKGGKCISYQGYVMILKPEHPRNIGKYRYVPEQILVIEKDIGRFLKKNEVVHHINGKKDDNRLENLLLCTKKEHKSIHAIKRSRNKIGQFTLESVC